MRISIRSLGVPALCGVLLFVGCAGNMSNSARPMAEATPPADTKRATAGEGGGGPPRWVWVSLAAVGAATAIALIFAFVIVPGIAESAGEGFRPGPSNGDGGGGTLP